MNVLKDISVNTAELNKLSGTQLLEIADINKLSGLETTANELLLLTTAQPGTVVNNKAAIYGSDGSIDATKLKIGGVEITASAENINSIAGLSVGSAELNKLVGLNINTDELELLNTSEAGEIIKSKVTD